MSPAPDPHFSFLDELDARQDDLLLQLDQLNTRIETLLSQFSTPTTPPPSLAWPAESVSQLAEWAGDA